MGDRTDSSAGFSNMGKRKIVGGPDGAGAPSGGAGESRAGPAPGAGQGQGSEARRSFGASALITAMQNLDLAAMVCRLEGEILFVNDSFGRMLGYPREQTVGTDIAQFVSVDYVEVVQEIGTAIKGGRARGFAGSAAVAHRDGTRLQVQYHVTSIENDGEVIVICLLQDLSDLYWAEPSAARRESLSTNVPDP